MKPLSTIVLRRVLATLAVLFLLAAQQSLFAHAGHDAAPGDDGEAATSGPVAISAEAKTNLGVTVAEAEVRTLETTLLAIGRIDAIPSHSAAVTSRIPGRVYALNASEGDTVKKGEPLVEVESRQIGDPPPRVTYNSPISGIVTDRHVVLNENVEPDKHLLEIVDLSEVYAEGQIFEGQIASVKKGQPVRVEVESFPDETFTGTVDVVSGSLDPDTRTLKVWVRVQNPGNRLRPNMRATLHIVTAEADSVTAVPHSAVLGDAGNLFVFVQEDADGLVYERRPVVTGMSDDRYVEMIEGVFPGDKVVTLGNYQLQYVTTRKAPAKAKGAAANDENAPHTGAAAKPAWVGPLAVMGWTVAGLLALNLVALVVRRRPRSPIVKPQAASVESSATK